MKKHWMTVLIALAVFFSGCSLIPVETKTFTNGDMSVTLTNRFIESRQEGYSACYDSADMGVFALREEFGLFDGSEYGADTSLTDYRDLIIATNEVNAVLFDRDGLTGFSFTGESEGDSYAFFAFVYKGSEAFWLLQFATHLDDAEALQEKIVSYAKSVTVS